MARQKLVTREVLARLPPLRSTHGKDPRDVRVRLKLFDPGGAGTWYCTEFDPATRTLFGLACIQVAELGCFSLDELKGFRGPLGIGIERDVWWDETTTLADVIAGRTR
jgi:hypothetical protein